ncbi:MAG: SDR family oxidoreductase [Polyangiaceae bacterium]|nr:SDR family oxidoreductase [Polyangiaceae bacterium]
MNTTPEPTNAAPVRGDLSTQRALVTGAGHRVGRSIALALGRAGMHVAVHYFRQQSGALETCELIRQAGGQATPIQADLSERQAARDLGGSAIDLLGGLELLVSSAANFENIVYDDVNDDAWNRSMELNVAAPFALAQACTPALRKSRGNIVFITCSSTTTPLREYLPYVVSKGALKQLMRVMSLELAPDVRVNAVAPGTVLPPPSMSGEQQQRIEAHIPLARVGEAADIADAVIHLARSPFVTGQELIVDGGRTVAAFEKFG